MKLKLPKDKILTWKDVGPMALVGNDSAVHLVVQHIEAIENFLTEKDQTQARLMSANEELIDHILDGKLQDT